MGFCGGDNGTAVPESAVDPTFGWETTASNCVPDNPVAITLTVRPFNCTPGVLDKPEIDTLTPGMKLLTAWNVTTSEVMDSDVIVATELHVAAAQPPKGAMMSVIRLSGALLPPVEIVLVVVSISAIAPPSQILTYTWLLSVEAVVNIRKRVLPGAYVVAGTHEVTGGTAYWVPVNCGVLSSDNEGVGDSKDEGGVLTVMLRASNTVSMGMMQGADGPTFGSEQAGSEA
jgi:hypothetical protein